MKYVVVIGDGMADRPLEILSGKTPLEVAKKPGMDRIARDGRCGLLKTLREDMPYGSDIANMSVLGYDPSRYYPGGRGSLEAAAMGIKLEEGDLAFRCNLVSSGDGVLKDYSAGHISTGEARLLIQRMEERFGSENIRFHPGISYRHIMVLRNSGLSYTDLQATPPHDIVGEDIESNLIRALTDKAGDVVEELNRVMRESVGELSGHAVNVKRMAEGKNPANMVWLWGCGKKPNLPPFAEKYGLKGAMISAVDLLKGIAYSTGLEYIEVPGATGFYDTDYAAKGKYALRALETNDFVYVHVEAPDEAAHAGNVEEKIRAIERIDREIISMILAELDGKNQSYRIAILPDHATPIEVRTHTPEPVPFAIYSSEKTGDTVDSYDEKQVREGSYGLVEGTGFMRLLTVD